MPEEPEPRTLDLRDYLRVVRRFKWTIVVVTVLAVAAALGLSYLEEPVYRTQSKLLLAPSLAEQIFAPQVGRESERTLANEIEIMASPRVRREVAQKLGRAPDVTIGGVGDTDVIVIGAESTDAEEAAETATVYAETYIEIRRTLIIEENLQAQQQIQGEIATLDGRIGEIDASIAASPPAAVGDDENAPVDPRLTERARLVSRRSGYAQQIDQLQTGASAAELGGATLLAAAGVPSSPVNQTPIRNGIAGLAVGLMLGVALAFLREYLDDSVKTKEDLERVAGVTVVGLIPALPEWKDRKSTPLIALEHPRSQAAEAYRTLRTSVEFLALEHPIESLQVTSAMATEGKTTTLANLATTFARAGQRVIILCCDLRRPRVHEFFGLTNTVGFTSVLLGDTPLPEAIQPVPGDLPLGLVASGPLPPNPAELLSSRRAADVIEGLEDRCDLLLVDSPPVVPVTDALVVSGLVDALLLVADSGGTTKRGLSRATELLRQVDAPIAGAVLNGVRRGSEYGYQDDGAYYYAADQDAPSNGRQRSRRPARAAR
jgi:capsular exopolysaccharide synthesis family protein